ncbi:hypothetical protein [Eubacterium maltosivorans]|uniref:hypothetical protein n=1 Tax=Eubacterium maltosivorans TaxID=2041044 RepID=UPI0018A09951|nr:hypothetical protein [Eubacterium maltosivorans]
MSEKDKDSLTELREVVPKLDNSSREMLLSYAAGMIAQKKLEEKKAVGERNGVSSDKNTA